MATSANTLETIINTLARKYKFDSDEAIKILAESELLPKKLIPKETKADGNIWSSKKAEELASQYKIVPTGEGSGKNGKWTLKDIEKLMEKPTKDKINISPNALNLANDNKLSLSGKVGSGKDGRILLKDVELWIKDEKDDDDDDDLNISPRALMEANQNGLSEGDLTAIHGTGKDGRILLEDVKKYITSTDTDDSEDDESSEDEDEDEDEKPERKKKNDKKKGKISGRFGAGGVTMVGGKK
jgi:pyruvate/2-oxoglutarate dehydrogenase complex dihydrolipoamide acyltransferase (E2) component